MALRQHRMIAELDGQKGFFNATYAWENHLEFRRLDRQSFYAQAYGNYKAGLAMVDFLQYV